MKQINIEPFEPFTQGLVQSPTIELQRETLSCTSNEHITHCSPGTSQHDTGATTRVKNENLSSSLHGFYDSNASEITSLLHQPQLEPQPTPQLEPQTHVYEDIEMTFVQFPMPLPPPAEPVLQKRENDAFSGDMAFGEYVSIFSYNFYIVTPLNRHTESAKFFFRFFF